tara:strand:+ start:3786 stop:5246 length:1461 start_codon:yes stop_codon:yes gene_type:complete
MTIQSLGVGSGLALDDLVRQLISAERTPKEQRLDAREERVQDEISALGQIKSKISAFKDAVDDLRTDASINGREPTITHPSEDIEIFSAEATNTALRGSYDISVSQLASGSRIETADAAFTSPTDAVLTDGAGDTTMTFKIDSTGDSFTVNVTQNMTLAELREAINNNADNFGVNANIIDTGTATGGAKLVFTSDTTGTGNDLVIVNDGDRAELDRLTTTDSAETATNLTPVLTAANAKATIDGIQVESETNTFDNTIQNVTFTANKVSPLNSDGVTRQSSTMEIGYDKEGLETKINDFIDSYNGIIDEIKNVTRYGESELEEDGALAGDSLLRGVSSRMATIVGSSVQSSELGGLFAIGIELTTDGKLEISSTDFGLGSGESRFDDALENSFDDIAKIFTDETQGIATRLYDIADEYASSGGLISSREKAAKDNQSQIDDARARLEQHMLGYEAMVRAKYLNLDQTVSRLNQTGSALLASLGSYY